MRQGPLKGASNVGIYLGWDIGGAHLKLSLLQLDRPGRARIGTSIEPFEIWRSPETLAHRLTGLLARNGIEREERRRSVGSEEGTRHAVTMTAELSDVFLDRREGVRSVLRACSEALGPGSFRVLTLDGELVHPDEVRERPLSAAAANWVATAHLIARRYGASILVDVGSTTTDIIPIGAHGPTTTARDDTGRLMSGELIYTGALRTPPSSLSESVPLRGGTCRVSTERFCTMADVYRVLGRIEDADYTVPTADGRGTGREESAARLSRLVCADHRDLTDTEIATIAAFLERRQIDLIERGLRQVQERTQRSVGRTSWIAGVGAFLARSASERSGRSIRTLGSLLPGLAGRGWDRAAPSAALALLLADEQEGLLAGPSR